MAFPPRQLYNLRHVLERDEENEDTKVKIRYCQDNIKQHNMKYPMKLPHIKDALGNDAQGNKKKREDGERPSGNAGGVSETDYAELGAYGYEVEPQDIEDERGYAIMSFFKVWQPLSALCAALTLDLQMLPHILTVYQRSDPSKRFVAKKVREQSNELELLKLLNSLKPKSEHIISIHQSFQTHSALWVILPKMTSIAHYFSMAPN